MLTACLAILCVLLMLVLLVQRPAIWPVLVVLAAAWCIGMGLFRYRLRSQLARWVCGGDFTKSKTKFSLEPLSQPVVLLSGETVLWYNGQFRQRMLGGQDLLVSRVQKVIPGLDLQQARTQEGQQLTLADGVWSAHSSTVPGDAETMTLVVFNEETALRRVEAEYKASRPGYLVFLVDGYDDVFSDMLDSERARLLEGINRVLEEMIGRGTGFLRRVASGRYIAVVEERQLEQFAKRGYDVLDKIRALDPSVNLSLSIGIGRGAKTLREAQDGDGLILRFHLLGTGLLVLHDLDDAAVSVLEQVAAQRGVRRGGAAKGDTEVSLLHIAVFDGSQEELLGLGGLGDDDQTAGAGVQPVAEGRGVEAVLLVFPLLVEIE